MGRHVTIRALIHLARAHVEEPSSPVTSDVISHCPTMGSEYRLRLLCPVERVRLKALEEGTISLYLRCVFARPELVLTRNFSRE